MKLRQPSAYLNRAARTLITLLGAIAATTGIAAAAGEDYPDKPIRMIVGSVPGSAPDVLARLIGEHVKAELGQSVVVDNRAGATGTIAAALVSRAPADGYTLYTAAAAISTTPAVFKLSYDVRKDFAAVGRIASVPLILVVNASGAVRSVGDLVKLAKARPGQINYATPGPGGLQHLVTELFDKTVGIKMVHVPYKGGSLAVLGVLGGEAQLFFSGMPPALPLVRQGRLRALAVTTKARSRAAPEVPTMAEAGIAGFEADNWHGVLAPAGTPANRVARLNAVLKRALADPTVKKVFLAAGAEAEWSTPADFQSLVNAEVQRWGKLAREIGLRPQ